MNLKNQVLEQNASFLSNYLKENRDRIKEYKKFAKVLARAAKPGEQIQTKLNGRNETSIRIAKPGEWVVSNVNAFGELQLVSGETLQKRYDTENGVPYNNEFTEYSPKNAFFYGLRYTGSEITFAPPNWGGTTQTITSGYMLGATSVEALDKDFYGIDPEAFQKTYKLV